MSAEQNADKRPGTAISVLRSELNAMTPEFQNALPSHISPERFGRVALTAIQNNPELLEVDRRSVWKACMQAAQDGLLPDGRQGAIVVRWNNRLRCKEAAWQPMIAGVRLKAQNAGQIATWDVEAVYANDDFEFELGDHPFIRHCPALNNRGDLIAAYSVATLKTGDKSRAVMGVDEAFAIRDEFSSGWQAYKAGKIKTTPWASAPGEMVKKTVAHRHAKVLPVSADIRDLLLKGDDIKTAEAMPAGAMPPVDAKPRLSIRAQLDALAEDPTPETSDTIEHDPKTGEIKDFSAADGEPASEPAQLKRGKITIESGIQKPPAKAELDPRLAAEAERREMILADLVGTGNALANDGLVDLRQWLDNDLTPEEMALITPEQESAWIKTARAADAKSKKDSK